MSSLVVAKPESEFEKAQREYSDARKHAAKHGTPSEKVSIAATDAVLRATDAFLTIGLCSHVVTFVLSSFDATKNLPHKGSFATGVCATLYADFYLSYIEMQKAEEKQKIEEDKKS